MTWIEGLLLGCAAGIVAGTFKRRTFAARTLLAVRAVTMVLMLGAFGGEFISDLL